MIDGQQEITYARNDIIFHESERPDGVYIVKDGLVQIFQSVQTPEGVVDVELGRIGARGMFGEMGLIDHRPRSASAKALGPTTLLFIPKEQFRKHLEQLPPWVTLLIKTFVHRLRETNDRLVEVLEARGESPAIHLHPHDLVMTEGEGAGQSPPQPGV
ncbi:MAG: Crp/Fnr family transcriptional regulator [Candidatus Methylacidiphilales bacterium]|nr:Crp/Fnr family transcriptional regulator [Candidatus Methylacidiphilales bacterium]